MRKLLRTLTALAVLVAVPMLAASAHAKRCAGVVLPNMTRVGDDTLVLNGMGIREATVLNVDVYVAGLYLKDRSSNAAAILNADEPRRLVLKFVRDVDRSDITEAWTNGFRHSGMASALGGEIRQLNSWMSAMEEGDVMIFTYVPDAGLQVTVKGQTKGTIEGADFAKAFFGIWLGDKPPNAGLKRGLLGGECG